MVEGRAKFVRGYTGKHLNSWGGRYSQSGQVIWEIYMEGFQAEKGKRKFLLIDSGCIEVINKGQSNKRGPKRVIASAIFVFGTIYVPTFFPSLFGLVVWV